MPYDPASIVRSVRERAALSQRALAERAHTSQSVVARIELGETSPTWETLTRLVDAAGFALEVGVAALSPVCDTSHAAAALQRDIIRAISPAQRLAQAFVLSEANRRLLVTGLRVHHPALTDLQLVELSLGRRLVPAAAASCSG